MLPAGYLLKNVVPPPEWFRTGANHIKDICNVADCVIDNVVDVQKAWKHNSFGVANSPDVLWSLTKSAGVSANGAKLFYYTAFEDELEPCDWIFDASSWRPRSPALSVGVEDAVEIPAGINAMSPIGYDVVVLDDFLEHSPLLCNSAAERLQVNEHCLLPSLQAAVKAINDGSFEGCEEGIYTVFAVYLIN